VIGGSAAVRHLRRRQGPAPGGAAAGGKDVANAPSAEKLMAEKGLDPLRCRARAATGAS
jgi:2-oxoglutarate dehydrogenase E2 component (dihydrolipoamide succinyltransferase)